MFSKYFSIVTFASLVLFAFNMLAGASEVEVKPLLHPLFADHAVLQRDSRVPVWGWSAPGTTIVVSFADQKKTATAAADGKWITYLDPMAASSEGRILEVQSADSKQKVKISDILVGDVWLCTGQSNMEMGVGVCNVSDKIAVANFPLIRLMMVPKNIAYTPESTLRCNWLPCSPANLIKGGWGGFSAAGYFFGLELHRTLDVPVGLIETCWGGTVCEAWTSSEALATLGDFASGIEQVKQVAAAPEKDKIGAVMDRWYQANDPGTQRSWFKSETDVSTWKEAKMPANWQACGIPGYEGIVWVQKTFEIPATWAGRDLVLSFGTIGDCDQAWVNGNAVGRTVYFDEPRFYKVPAAFVKAGRNVITMRVINSGSGGFFGPADQMKVYPSGNESSAISLAGTWRVQETATRASTGAPLIGNPNVSSVLFNGMIAPLIPFAIKGAIWYQGESNADRGYQYRKLLPTMIRDWRFRFGVGDFGFHIVSLANYKNTSHVPRESEWAELREAQAMAAKALPNCGIAMAIDIGDAADIHPKNKNEVGRRLALSALAITYGKNLEWSGPWYKSMEINGSSIKLSFDHAQSGLVAKGNKLTGFAIAGADRNFVWADAVIEGTAVRVSSPDVPSPVAVRYGWDTNPACNLYNKENLPAVPFRTDDWPGITKRTAQ
ncbi:MAG TPA: sialate O-acetylesterase [Bacteroidales bacterium]|nr:sialate O-acetylesterase [Bacteroidales bacterium]